MSHRLAGIAVAAMLLCGLVLGTPRPAGAVGPQPTCPWTTHLDPNTTNVAFPDQNANYFTLSLAPSIAFTKLNIRGRFPHARYMSFTTYTGQTQAIDGINDVHILPKSTRLADNPFIAGHARNTEGAARDYEVTVVRGQKPAPPAAVPPNTIYTTDADGSHSNLASFIVIYRTYRPDAAFPNDGGGGELLPSVTGTLVSPPGTEVTLGDAKTCSTGPDPDLGVNGTLTNTTLPQVPAGAASCYPGLNPPAWHRFTNIATAEIQGTDNTCLMDNNPQQSLTMVSETAIPKGGFLENPDNKYIAAILNVDAFPVPDQPNVLVVRSRVPTTPDTFNNTPVMPGGQLRYWSMCSNEGITTRFYACVMDDGLARLSAAGDYCLVVSRTTQRPRNANAAHRVNWLPFGALHDNVLIERNMLPDAAFGPAIQNVAPGNEQKGLGPYFPTSTYMSAADFEQSGCPGFAATTRFGAIPGDIADRLPTTGAGTWPLTLVAVTLGGLAVASLRGSWSVRSR
jgi:hypothetical protein